MTPDEIEEAAAALFAAEITGQQIGLLSQANPGMSLENAYAVQRALVEKRKETGRVVTGWKIGLTAKAMQDALKIDTPDSGVLFEDMAFKSGDTVPEGRFLVPRVEAEIAFVMKSDISAAASRDEVLAATDYVCAAMEILDTRVRRFDPASGALRQLVDTVSDNASNAGYVLGDSRHDPSGVDLRRVGAIVQRNGAVEETGLGAGVLNDPVASIVWLTERLESYGMKISAGDVVLSGSFIRPIDAKSGDTFEAEFGEFGNVKINFA
ncbi:2-oxo-hepta-3-ene-1,7-dioic acid hydratase [Aliishimia ponticola]|uniref:2-oxo-hepta-3-ene-1,7-dioic acid hydratase n=1 Tax=Aliishimia ponticola TaxID=2499833 RepID=A0A4S4NFU2_9RHOB|nr:2-keto-4-pentenoate hydratase [Aliishimia ponticola]THH37487.1 2-oxo-hepta-3-ene-1,7-dioic acid hydratase [Aliishimia ponticola]